MMPFKEDYDPKYDELAEETTPGNYTVSRFTDCFGREMEAHKCEYCGKRMPLAIMDPFSSKLGAIRNLMTRIELDNGCSIYRCNECAVDIINKSDV